MQHVSDAQAQHAGFTYAAWPALQSWPTKRKRTSVDWAKKEWEADDQFKLPVPVGAAQAPEAGAAGCTYRL